MEGFSQQPQTTATKSYHPTKISCIVHVIDRGETVCVCKAMHMLERGCSETAQDEINPTS
jgi:hypothetical protein